MTTIKACSSYIYHPLTPNQPAGHVHTKICSWKHNVGRRRAVSGPTRLHELYQENKATASQDVAKETSILWLD